MRETLAQLRREFLAVAAVIGIILAEAGFGALGPSDLTVADG